MCYIQVKNIRLNSFYEEKKIKLCLTKQLLNMFKLWCEWGISDPDVLSHVSIYSPGICYDMLDVVSPSVSL